MKDMNLKLKSKYVYFLLLAIIILISILPWFRSDLPMTDDFRHHVVKFWFIQSEGSIPSWIDSMYGGWPFLHFYHPLMYYLLFPLILLISPTLMLKVAVVLFLILSGIAAYWAYFNLFKNHRGALVTATIYLFSGMHMNQITITGSIPRQLAFVFLPLAISFFITALKNHKPSHILLAALFSAGALLSHVSISFPIFLLMGLYLSFVIVKKQLTLKSIKTLLLFSLIFSGFIVWWAVPLFAEKSAANIPGDSSIFASVGGPVFWDQLFARKFGNWNNGTNLIRSYYVGFSVLLLSFASLLLFKNQLIQFLILGSGFSLLFSFFNDLYRFIPFAQSALTSASYTIVVFVICTAFLSGKIVDALSKKIKQEHIFLLFILIILVVDLGPLAKGFSYNWTNQDDKNFYNPPDLIQAWNSLKGVPNTERIFSPSGQAAFLYHENAEFGYGWQGYPQGPSTITYNTHTQINSDFNKDPLNNQTHILFGFFGTKHYVLPCNNYPLTSLKLKNQFTRFCTYENLLFEPLILAPETIERKLNVSPYNDVKLNHAFILEDCKDDCIIKNNPATITDVIWEPELITFKSESKKDSYILIKSNRFEGHWNAYIDNKPTKIFKAWPNYIMVKVEGGTHNIDLKYETNIIHILSTIFSLTIIIGLLIYLFRPKKQLNKHAQIMPTTTQEPTQNDRQKPTEKSE